MLVRSVEAQCKARAARSAEREVVTQLGNLEVRGSTQLMRAAMLNNLPRVLRLVQLGAPLNVVDKSEGYSALHWASRSSKNESIAKALLDGKYSGRGASVDQRGKNGWTPLISRAASVTQTSCAYYLRAAPSSNSSPPTA